MNKKLLLAIGLTATSFASCKKDDDPTPEPAQKIPYSSLNKTSNYFQTFKGAYNHYSVDFSGQTTSMAMMKELDAYMRTALTTDLDAGKMEDMFRNQNNAFGNAALNAASDKTLFSKTAQSFSVS